MHIGTLVLPDQETVLGELMRINPRAPLALHAYQLLLVRGEQVFEYATIVETHHPEYLSENDLFGLYDYDRSTALSNAAISDLIGLVLHAGK